MDWFTRNLLTPTGYFTAAAVATLALAALLSAAWLGQPRRTALRLAWPVFFVAVAAWSALSCRLDWEWGEPRSVIIGILLAVGVSGAVWVAMQTINQIGKLSPRQAKQLIGAPARVYRAIPAQAQGQIELAAPARRRILPAVSDTGKPISAFTPVTIAAVRDDLVLIVRAKPD